MIEAAEQLGQRLQKEDGTGNAVKIIEQVYKFGL
jgi:hypothetical protein